MTQGHVKNGFEWHGTCMVLAWITFAGIGQLSARYLKVAFSKNGVWFKIHMGCLKGLDEKMNQKNFGPSCGQKNFFPWPFPPLSLTALLAISGLFIMLFDNEFQMPWVEWGSFENAGGGAWHAIFGFTTLALMTINLVSGFLRPNLDSKYRAF